MIGLGRLDDARKAILQGHRWLHEGWKEEYPTRHSHESGNLSDHETNLKLQVWQSGLWLAEGALYKAEGNNLLAEACANAVIALPHLAGETPETDSLRTRREQGIKLSESLKK